MLNYILLFSPTFIFAQNKQVKISFNPSTNTPYEYNTHTYANINGGFNSTRMSTSGVFKTVFKKEKEQYIATDKFSELNIISESKMIFSLNLFLEPHSRQQVLQDYFNTVTLNRKLDNKGNQIQGWDTSFILRHPYLRPSDKERILPVIKQLNNPTRAAYIDKPISIGTTFVDDDIVESGLLQITPKSLKTKNTVLDIRNNEVLFKHRSSFFLPIRNRDKEITGKKEIIIEGMMIIDIQSGMPLQGRNIILMGEDYVVTTFSKKGIEIMNPLNYGSGFQNSFRDISYSESKEEEKSYEEFVIPTEEKALEILNKTSPFLHINNSNSNYQRCHSIEAETSQFNKTVILAPLSVKGLDKNNEILFQQNFSKEHQMYLYNTGHSYTRPISTAYCDTPLSKVIVDCKLSLSYGFNKSEYVRRDYETDNNEQILEWTDKNITIVLGVYAEYFNEKNEKIRPIRSRFNNFPSYKKQIYGIPIKDVTASNYFLLAKTFTSTVDNAFSYTYEFTEKVNSIVVYEKAGDVSIDKKYELFPPDTE